MGHGVLIAKNTEKIDTLKAIAIQDLRQGGVCITMSDESTKLNREAIKTFEALESTLGNQNMQQLLVEMDESYMRASAFEAEDHFIEGFIRGYLFLQNLIMVPAAIDKIN